MTRNLKLFLGATIIFYIIGAQNDSTGMYVLAGACLAVILACFFVTRLIIRGVEVEIELHGTRSRAGGYLDATLRVENPGVIARAGMSLAVDVENETVPRAGEDYEFLLPTLPARSRTDLEVRFSCRARGAHRLRNARIIANDPLGVYHRTQELEAEGSFLALPRTYEAEGLAAWELLRPEGRQAARLMQRMGGDFRGIREHAPGDDLRHVHWKVTAHTGELAVKEYERRREAEVTIWLDLWRGDHLTAGPDGEIETAISLAATLLELFVRGDYVVSLAGQGLPARLALPSRGEAYLDHALVALAEATPVEGPSFSEFCSERAAQSPRLANVFAITTGAEEGLLDALLGPARRGAHPAVFLVGELLMAGRGPELELPQRERDRRMLGRLRAAGIPATEVADWQGIPDGIAQMAGQASTRAGRVA